jgi:CRISPR-associated protein Csb1
MTTSRILFDVALKPAIGSRFQPTGFPDIGAADFDRPDGKGGWEKSVLVESTQSMANRLECMAWDDGVGAPVDVFAGLPYVRVVDASDGRYLTSSRTEAHRLASAFVKDSKLAGVSMVDEIKNRLGLRDDTPIPQRSIASAIFALDPFCLLHGVFFADSKWPGQPKVTRAISAFVEAVDVKRADSGGVKRDSVRHGIKEGGGTAEGYGSVPFHRTEWTARDIIASFSVDRRQIRSYGLGDAGTALLENIALWEISSLLEDGLRLRTACDLVPIDDVVLDRGGVPLPARSEVEANIRKAIAGCKDQLGTGGAIDVQWADGGKKEKKS